MYEQLWPGITLILLRLLTDRRPGYQAEFLLHSKPHGQAGTISAFRGGSTLGSFPPTKIQRPLISGAPDQEGLIHAVYK